MPNLQTCSTQGDSSQWHAIIVFVVSSKKGPLSVSLHINITFTSSICTVHCSLRMCAIWSQLAAYN